MASAVEALALIAMSRGSSERSATLLGAGEAIWRSIPTTILEPYRADHDRTEADARAALGTAHFEAAHRAGLEMSRDEVVDYALEVRPSGTRVVVAPSQPSEGPLSRREMEVAALVAEGATNAQVAGRLFISERTVESHVASIFNKLGVDSRVSRSRVGSRAHRRSRRSEITARSMSEPALSAGSLGRTMARVVTRGRGPQPAAAGSRAGRRPQRSAAARDARGSRR